MRDHLREDSNTRHFSELLNLKKNYLSLGLGTVVCTLKDLIEKTTFNIENLKDKYMDWL